MTIVSVHYLTEKVIGEHELLLSVRLLSNILILGRTVKEHTFQHLKVPAVLELKACNCLSVIADSAKLGIQCPNKEKSHRLKHTRDHCCVGSLNEGV